jgi:hypothetical protein
VSILEQCGGAVAVINKRQSWVEQELNAAPTAFSPNLMFSRFCYKKKQAQIEALSNF